jgi:hypothetical protein
VLGDQLLNELDVCGPDIAAPVTKDRVRHAPRIRL